MGAIRVYWLAILATILTISTTAVTLPAKPQATATAADPALVVKGLVKQEVRLTLAELKVMPHTKLSVKGHDAVMHEYEGVPLKNLLAKAGVPLAADLRGQSMALYIIADAADNYRAVFSLAELDDDFAAEVVIVADTADCKELGADQGPLRLVVPGDKRQGRWVRMLRSIVVARAGS
ncbi:MAG TPA: molybdopterin-dependent oxidoreductase [Candidatus Eisenbacteria bacterium]|jgi:DMSO/TMAO reductase YedYZ molybdopterin-dependent catalytic subunit|nr:molybdopterin-dependent oxidoreductase [Candidatus Eisenbacteria bacterium]